MSTFVIQSVQNLQPDYTAISASLLTELVGNQQTTSNISIPLPPSYLTTSFSPSLTDVLVNSLWFISLTLSLITALVAVLTKQWLHQYISVGSDISPISQGWIRQCQYMGLEKWQVPMIIGFPSHPSPCLIVPVLPWPVHLSVFTSCSDCICSHFPFWALYCRIYCLSLSPPLFATIAHTRHR